jgi:hypothetical protein
MAQRASTYGFPERLGALVVWHIVRALAGARCKARELDAKLVRLESRLAELSDCKT